MTTITILPESHSSESPSFLAISGSLSSKGKTAGEALDALENQLGEEAGETLVILRHHRPDAFFSAEKRERLARLMTEWRVARDAGGTLSPDEQTELEGLVEAELRASQLRTQSMLDELGR